MANLQIKGVDEALYAEIKKMAAAEKRSISQQVLYLVRDYLAKRAVLHTARTPAEVLLDLHGSWQDERGADEIIGLIKAARKRSKRRRAAF